MGKHQSHFSINRHCGIRRVLYFRIALGLCHWVCCPWTRAGSVRILTEFNGNSAVNKTHQKEEVKIQAKTSQAFVERLIEMIGPDEKSVERQSKQIFEQIMFASVAKLVTGKDVKCVYTPTIVDGRLDGISGEITGDAVEAMAQMGEDIIKAAVPHILFVCNKANKPDFGSFLADLLAGVQGEEDDGEGDDEEPAKEQSAA